MTNLIQSKSII